MTLEQIKNSIDRGELHLKFWDKITHYEIVLVFFFIPIIFLYHNIKDYIDGFSIRDWEFEIWFSIPSIALGIFFYKIQKFRLKFQTIKRNLPNDDLKFIIEEVIKELDWKVKYVEKNIFVATTRPGFLSGSFGERITLLLDEERIYVNSICDTGRRSSISSNGRNRENMQTLIEKIEKKQVANN